MNLNYKYEYARMSDSHLCYFLNLLKLLRCYRRYIKYYVERCHTLRPGMTGFEIISDFPRAPCAIINFTVDMNLNDYERDLSWYQAPEAECRYLN